MVGGRRSDVRLSSSKPEVQPVDGTSEVDASLVSSITFDPRPQPSDREVEDAERERT
jgi:hypothetical protein